MKAGIYNPYLDTLGGGERYTLSFAKVLVDEGYEVDLEWNSPEIIKSLENRFGIGLNGINVVKDVNRGDGYDLCFWVSDGSIPALKSRENILHFQVPFHDVNGKSLINKMKLFRVNNIICNSNFTKRVIDQEFGVNSLVIYPPTGTDDIKPKRKENIILNVSRFSSLLQSKHQDILIKEFKKLFDSGTDDWKLILAGGVEVGADEFVKSLEKQSKGYPIEIIKSPNFKTLVELYGKAKIFWSATGFEVNESEHPEAVEHFGITIVEGMAAGVVPAVYSAGGHKEIINNSENGYLWENESELLKFTRLLINDKSKLKKMSRSAVLDSSNFSYAKFRSNIIKIL